jgi:uncharacterized protein (DUF302 family)
LFAAAVAAAARKLLRLALPLPMRSHLRGPGTFRQLVVPAALRQVFRRTLALGILFWQAADRVVPAQVGAEDKMTIAKVEVERFSLTSSKPFDAIVAALKSAIGKPDMAEFFRATRAATSFPDLERIVQSGLGHTGLMLFAEFDLGAILRRETGSTTPKITRFVVGNPLIMKEMVKHVHDAGSYAPVTVLIDERPDGVHVSYDKMESYLRPYGSSEALAVARNLDGKITTLLRECAS